MSGLLRRFWADTGGAIAILFAVVLPLLLLVLGGTIDFTIAMLEKQRLQAALDAAVVSAVASGETDTAALRGIIQSFMEVNYGHIDENDISINNNGLSIDVNISGTHIPYTIFPVISYFLGDISISASSGVAHSLGYIDVVLSIDVSMSMMEWANGTNIVKMDTIRNAIYGFTDIMEEVQERYGGSSFRIGLLPWGGMVKVGPYGLGYDTEDQPYGAPFITGAAGMTYGSGPGEWGGCVNYYESYPNAVKDRVGPFDAYKYVFALPGETMQHLADRTRLPYRNVFTVKGTKKFLHVYSAYWYNHEEPLIKNNNLVYGYGGRAQYDLQASYSWNLTANQDLWRWANEPYGENAQNYLCNEKMPVLLPLTVDYNRIRDEVAEYWPSSLGTHGWLGIVWAHRMLSPEPPFEEGRPWDAPGVRRAIVFLTDGVNAYWPVNSIWPVGDPNMNTYVPDPTTQPGRADGKDIATLQREACDKAKKRGIEIYTVGFMGGDQSLLLYCATDELHYYNVEDSDDLLAVFEEIATDLSPLRVAH